ncbi:uncharacterized protein EAF01_004800 [Botrytis porri]|uniref:Uncharacterized protein n=1 Tax=Botrytis porri TaxID=87229 RepID=A0A4Z1K4U7_9HELO|nr:uncharacterized protein EAF01_004800 [Botrytis porri]KAF7907213.1 hypothetical protein EAF01_004800 [Botrytis porri]TGO81151.1 hypothetical protein BPOR_1317g00010 [Botrytis porri]
MAQTPIETPPSLPSVLAQNIKFIKKEYELDPPSSLSFGPRIFGGLATSVHGAPSSPKLFHGNTPRIQST